MKSAISVMMALPLAACATTSFAPPAVNPQVAAKVGGPAGCGPRAATGEPLGRNVASAMTLTDNFIYAYRCAERELANGRQYFQVPAFFAAVAGLVGPTLGLGNDGVLIAGTSAGVFNAGNSYYAPKAKAGIVGSAYRALVCIKTEAAGISYFRNKEETPQGTANVDPAEVKRTIEKLEAQVSSDTANVAMNPEEAQRLSELEAQYHSLSMAWAAYLESQLEQQAMGTVWIDAETQYFEMVSGALFSVESILSERLRDTGSTDTADVFAKLKELAKAHADAEAALKAAQKKAGGSGGDTGVGTMLVNVSPDQQQKLVKLENEVLQPKLQICVLQART